MASLKSTIGQDAISASEDFQNADTFDDGQCWPAIGPHNGMDLVEEIVDALMEKNGASKPIVVGGVSWEYIGTIVPSPAKA
jgi:hypothetical protein